MKREIFRTSALNRMSSPEQLDQMLQVTSARSWVALIAVGIVLVAGLIWGIWGRIATKSPGKGVVMRTGNLVTVGSLGEGRVISVFVHSDSVVHRGQVIATVSQPLLEEKLDTAKLALAKLQGHMGPQAAIGSTDLSLQMDALEAQRKALNQQIAAVQQQRKDLQAQLASTEQLYARGLVTGQQVTSLREQDASLNNQISSLRVQLVQLQGSEYKARIGQRVNNESLQSQIRDAAINVKFAQTDYDIASQVVSPYNGQVVQVQAQPGNLVAQGSTIVTMQPESHQVQVVAYVPAISSRTIHAGMEAEIIPSSVRPEEFGFMRGRVLSVADYPATDQDLMNAFQNSALTQMMSAGGSVTEVRVALDRDPATPSGFAWSSRQGAPIRITPGTICTVNIITKEERPIRMLFPYVKAKLGMY